MIFVDCAGFAGYNIGMRETNEKPRAVDKISEEADTLEFSNVFLSHVGLLCDQPYQYITMNKRYDYCIQYVVRGKGEFFAGNVLYPLSRGALFLLPKQRYHYYKSDEIDPYSYYWACFNGDGFERFLSAIGLTDDNPVIFLGENDEVEKAFVRLTELAPIKNKFASLETLSSCYRLLGAIAAALPSPREEIVRVPNSAVKAATDYIAENYTRSVSLGDLARAAHVDKCYLVTLFKKHTGVSPVRYLIRYRVSVACKLLGDDLSVTEIGARCGFSDPTNFFVRFKQVTGLTPSAYRKTMLPERG